VAWLCRRKRRAETAALAFPPESIATFPWIIGGAGGKEEEDEEEVVVEGEEGGE